jgi:hypothetical protein
MVVRVGRGVLAYLPPYMYGLHGKHVHVELVVDKVALGKVIRGLLKIAQSDY